MPTKIKIESTPYQEKLVTLNGQSLSITVMYNSSDDVNGDGEGSWYFDLTDRNKVSIISGVKVQPTKNLTNLTGKYLHLNKLLGGSIWCANTKNDGIQIINRDNFYTNGKFQLWYYSDQEILDSRLEGL
ncbi:hypothetical protein AXI76_gp017 [Pseudoalteromonas phage H101]|uniref:Cyanophage baseplate Pam3 plug gp18 domain-containing protein n=1 Tax=Pseudoalteromonas phage H101 TaxID=1654919 RepID=A0A0H4IRM3_9CAUD|nr:hypothetical protein AXI76_gp017 [Pseudoalteromonas phage H101]AKO60918.1 hypothetical protein [Pseudoalteromonas phage H101]